MRRIWKVFSFLAILMILLFLYFPALSKYLKLKRHEEGLIHEIADLKAKVEELKKEQYLIKNDPAHLEQVMRKELGLVRPGEVVYKIVPVKTSPSPETEETSGAKNASPPKI